MKLRTRLLLWVGALFSLAFGVSLLFESYTIDTSLKQAQAHLREEIATLAEKKRKSIEAFLHASLASELAPIDALLLRLSGDDQLGSALFLRPKNLDVAAPAHSALLVRDKSWIDCIETTKNQELTSLLLPAESPLAKAHYIPIGEHFGWVVLNCDRAVDRPLIGVRYREGSTALPLDQLLEPSGHLMLLFDLESLRSFERPPSVKGSQMLALLDSTEEAAAYLKASGKQREWIRSDILKRRGGRPFAQNNKEQGEAQVTELAERQEQGSMITALALAAQSGVFGDSLLGKQAPCGAICLSGEKQVGSVIFTEDVFLSTPLFIHGQSSLALPQKSERRGTSHPIVALRSGTSNQVLIGNSLKLEDEGAQGYLTVGVSVSGLVQRLGSSTGQSAFLVHGAKVVSAFSGEGALLADAIGTIPFRKSMLDSLSGQLTWKGKRYSFLHMHPFADVDLHFYIIEPEKSAFSLVGAISDGSRWVLARVSLNMRLIALVSFLLVLAALHRISRRITEPISRLAACTRDVAQGQLDGIKLPTSKKGKGDEVATLITSFDQMITGLREKEKVKGVLDKVVSPEIAREITKGNIHLGGEERRVTVLFGDIRNFTRMSAHRDPADVVEMLNGCMTKISAEIDALGGVIDKYVGDEVMALFGAPIELEDGALKATLAAVRMVEVLKQWNRCREEEGKVVVEMGFGIHTGVVLAGNMGAENRLNYTVIGSNVNFASRLCSAAQGMEVLISKETLQEPHVQENLIVEEYPPVQIKGYDEAFTVYVVKGSRGT